MAARPAARRGTPVHLPHVPALLCAEADGNPDPEAPEDVHVQASGGGEGRLVTRVSAGLSAVARGAVGGLLFGRWFVCACAYVCMCGGLACVRVHVRACAAPAHPSPCARMMGMRDLVPACS